MFGLELGPTTISGLMTSVAGPLFLTVSVCRETRPIRDCAPGNRRAPADRLIDAGEKPIPERETTCGLPVLFEAIDSVAFRAPSAAGVNRTRTVQEPPTPIVLAAHALAESEKSPAFAPPSVVAPSTRLFVPVFLTVSV